MALFSFHIVIVIIVFIHSVFTANIFQMCTSHGDCPGGASCKPNSCKGYVCLCDPGQGANYSYTGCKKVSFINDACTDTTNCPYLSYCNANKRCECFSSARATATKRIHCLLKYRRALGETCSQDSQCPRFSNCESNKCVCMAGFRPKTDAEFWTNTLALDECIIDSFSLDICGSLVINIPSALLVSSSSISSSGVETIIPASSTYISSLFLDASSSTIEGLSTASLYPSANPLTSIPTTDIYQEMTSEVQYSSTVLATDLDSSLSLVVESTEITASETAGYTTSVVGDTDTSTVLLQSPAVSSVQSQGTSEIPSTAVTTSELPETSVIDVITAHSISSISTVLSSSAVSPSLSLTSLSASVSATSTQILDQTTALPISIMSTNIPPTSLNENPSLIMDTITISLNTSPTSSLFNKDSTSLIFNPNFASDLLRTTEEILKSSIPTDKTNIAVTSSTKPISSSSNSGSR